MKLETVLADGVNYEAELKREGMNETTFKGNILEDYISRYSY